MTDVQTLPSALAIARHRHDGAYLALVLDGGYEEAGSSGRLRAGAGDVVLHLPYEAHLDRVGRGGARVINLPVGADLAHGLAGGIGAARDVDAALRLARRDPAEAVRCLLDGWSPRAAPTPDWPDLLAAALARDAFALDDWADAHGLAPATVSRGFRRVFGVTPAAYRAEARGLRAWHALRRGRAPLADVAAAAGYADQAHMTRAIRRLTGRPPGAWRSGAD